MAVSLRLLLLLAVCVAGIVLVNGGSALEESFDWAEGSSGFSLMEESEGLGTRRALYWRLMHYYISYGALSADRVPCPPRSGRSYYTNSCYHARGGVNPYSRGCSAITRCRS
ncbi:protein RALF-like 34 [Wolffia australiana]